MANLSISGLLTSHNEKLSSMHGFQIIGFMTLLLRICVSRSAWLWDPSLVPLHDKVCTGSLRTRDGIWPCSTLKTVDGMQCGPVVRALALKSGDPEIKTHFDHWLNLIWVINFSGNS